QMCKQLARTRNPPLSFNTELMNALIGMTKGAAGLPRELRDVGYAARWIEFQFRNSAAELVRPELILASGQLSHALLFEWKSGANTEPDQLRRYSDVRPDDLRTKAFIGRNECTSHDVCVIGLAEFADRILIGIHNGGYRFPV